MFFKKKILKNRVKIASNYPPYSWINNWKCDEEIRLCVIIIPVEINEYLQSIVIDPQ